MSRSSTHRTGIGLCLAGLAVISLAVAVASAAEKPTIGIFLFRSDRESEVISRDAVLQQLKAEGFGEDKAVYLHEDAKADQARAKEIARKLAAAKPAVIVTITTPATLAAVREVKDIPIVFANVLDPVDAGIAKSLQSSGNNTTGTSIQVPTPALLNTLKRVSSFKRLGVLYNAKEKNSVSQLDDIKESQRVMGFEVVPESVEKGEEIPAAMERLVRKRADALFVTGAAVVNQHTETVAKLAIERKIPTVTNSDLRVNQGVLVGVVPNREELGKLSGMKAAQILRGAKPADIPIEMAKRFEIIINLKTAKGMGLKLPVDLLQSANRVIQ